MLALILAFFAAGHLMAHALPGSVVTLSRNLDALSVAIAVNVEDLVIAEPALAPLETMESGPVTAANVTKVLVAYFKDHMHLTHAGAPVSLTLVDAKLGMGENDHVGQFALLTLTFSGETDQLAPDFPLVLRYDAVMHEVRTHRASVVWSKANQIPITLTEFGFRNLGGQPSPILLNAP